MDSEEGRDKPENPLFRRPKRGEKRWKSDPREHWYCQAISDAVAEKFKDRKRKDEG
jgi:hypothetical protein